MADLHCSISACCKPHYFKGYCRPHYDRLRRHGDPLGGRTPEGEPLRFIHDVAMHHNGEECLIWPFGKDNCGYGSVKVGGKMIGTHRYVCELAHGAPPTPEHEAAHSCGKGHEGCIAPGHLDWKTHAQNMADTLAHGTSTRGERSRSAKLTEADVREIIALKGKETQREIAARFGVNSQNISNIHTGRTWAWLSVAVERACEDRGGT